MPQFLISQTDVQEKKFILRGQEAFHVSRVLRRREGDFLELFDGRGNRYGGVIERVLSDGTVEGTLSESKPKEEPVALAKDDFAQRSLNLAPNAVALRLNLYLGLLKSSHWDWALEKSCELGVASITPVITPRTVVRLSEETSPAKIKRWNKVLLAAAKQCLRADIPELKAPANFRDVVGPACHVGPTLVAWEKKKGAPYEGVRAALRGAGQRNDEKNFCVNLFIGPEGGFSDDEAELAKLQGATLFNLGQNILRAETAAICAASIILYEAVS